MADEGNKEDRTLTSQEALNRSLQVLQDQVDKLQEIVDNTTGTTGSNVDYKAASGTQSMQTGDQLVVPFGPWAVGEYGHTTGWMQMVQTSVLLKSIQSGDFYKVRAELQMYNADTQDWETVDPGLITYTEDDGGGFGGSPAVNGIPGVKLKAPALWCAYSQSSDHRPRLVITNEGDAVEVEISVYYDQSAVEIVQ